MGSNSTQDPYLYIHVYLLYRKSPFVCLLLISPSGSVRYRYDNILSVPTQCAFPPSGSQLVVPCVVVVYNVFDTMYWLDGKSFVKADQNQSVYYNTTE